jgi:hypothetical protein
MSFERVKELLEQLSERDNTCYAVDCNGMISVLTLPDFTLCLDFGIHRSFNQLAEALEENLNSFTIPI